MAEYITNNSEGKMKTIIWSSFKKNLVLVALFDGDKLFNQPTVMEINISY